MYVDYLILTWNCVDMILDIKKKLVSAFEMTYLGCLHYFLGIQILQLNDGLVISQTKYALDLLKKVSYERL